MKEEKKKEYTCPNCKGKLTYSLRKQILGNNCGCGFPHKNQRTWQYRLKMRLDLYISDQISHLKELLVTLKK